MAERTDWDGAMREALRMAQSPDAPFGENPRVGCVVVDSTGAVVGRGYHHGAGTPHAEVQALADAGPLALGATAVVTLEPCKHVGRTGPCTTALIEAGIAHVVFAQADPTAEGGGGAAVLAAAGVSTTGGVLLEEAEPVNRAWTFAAVHGRPMVTWKCAVSLDGRVAGPDGGPTAISGPPARELVHQLRAEVGAIIVGTGTALADDPQLAVRGGPPLLPPPLRVVIGSRPLRSTAHLLDGSVQTLLLDERDPRRVLSALYDRGVRHVLLEGGPTLAAAFRAAHVVDRIDWYIAPLLLGAGPVALPALGMPEAFSGVAVDAISVVGEDVRVQGWMTYESDNRART